MPDRFVESLGGLDLQLDAADGQRKRHLRRARTVGHVGDRNARRATALVDVGEQELPAQPALRGVLLEHELDPLAAPLACSSMTVISALSSLT